jgi:hypothetical protein
MHGKQRMPGTSTATGRFALSGFGVRTMLPTIKNAHEASRTTGTNELRVFVRPRARISPEVANRHGLLL